MISVQAPALPSSSVDFRSLIEQLQLDPEADRLAHQTLALISARASISGQNVDVEFQQLSQLLQKYQMLVKEIRTLAEAPLTAGFPVG
ncbi:MAG: hypothetical protein EAZ89_15395 [Bacteroidetes bacterium]|nr:MAG: hypothetical protein EAZ89_15395 [Bacteroidota bacterium]